jgi:uncharacterized repeat protein (TIGR03803 family)
MLHKMRIAKMTRLNSWKYPCAIFLFLAVTASASLAQTFTTLVNFDKTNGETPLSPLVQGFDGNIYGATSRGGVSSYCQTNDSCGTVFRITPSGVMTTIYNFCAQPGCPDGYLPLAGLTLGSDGNFYGTTQFGGNLSCDSGNGCGTVFKITPAGKFTTLHSWSGPDGFGPVALVEGSGGVFYGTTRDGGANGYGTFYKITAAGTLTTVSSFPKSAANPASGLVLATNGNFYGTTYFYPADHCGAVLEITPRGTLSTLHSFGGTDGCQPGGVVQGADGNFYGTTGGGGSNNDGTIFEIAPAGDLSTLYSFCPQNQCADGRAPNGLIQATDGNFYVSAAYGGSLSCDSGNGCGTIFRITDAGTLTMLHQFDFADGEGPGVLMQATDGAFFGTTTFGGTGRYYGTVFSLDVGLGPFVETNPTLGKAGAKVAILGNNLKGATSVTFGGTPTNFKAYASVILATVPAGATTGTVQVTTPSGTLKSNVPFLIIR